MVMYTGDYMPRRDRYEDTFGRASIIWSLQSVTTREWTRLGVNGKFVAGYGGACFKVCMCVCVHICIHIYIYIYIYRHVCVYVSMHALAQGSSLACRDPAAFSMNRPCDLEISFFEEQWQLDAFTRSAIDHVPAALAWYCARSTSIATEPHILTASSSGTQWS